MHIWAFLFANYFLFYTFLSSNDKFFNDLYELVRILRKNNFKIQKKILSSVHDRFCIFPSKEINYSDGKMLH